jgi:hypothetical protein
MLHVEVNWITGDPLRLSEAISYLVGEVRGAVERQHGSLGTSLLIDRGAGAAGFQSFWESNHALVASDGVIAAGCREAARRAGGAVTAERYEVLVFEREAPLPAGAGVRVVRVDAGPSNAAKVENAVAWYGDTAVPWLMETGGFCAALLYGDWTSGHLISQTVWRDSQALGTSRGTATAIEAAAAEAIDGVINAAEEFRLVYSSARAA